jgi:hypothetical protein
MGNNVAANLLTCAAPPRGPPWTRTFPKAWGGMGDHLWVYWTSEFVLRGGRDPLRRRRLSCGVETGRTGGE